MLLYLNIILFLHEKLTNPMTFETVGSFFINDVFITAFSCIIIIIVIIFCMLYLEKEKQNLY